MSRNNRVSASSYQGLGTRYRVRLRERKHGKGVRSATAKRKPGPMHNMRAWQRPW